MTGLGAALPPIDPQTIGAWLAPQHQDELLKLLEEHRIWVNRRLFYHLYPDENLIWTGDDNKEFDHGTTIFRRELYPRHLEHLAAGAHFTERCAMCANRVSKTLGMGAYETTCHLTGLYPHWWVGRRFKRPTRGWAAGKTNETTRDIIQATLFGDVLDTRPRKTVTGTGVIPYDLIDQASITWKQGVTNLIDTCRIRHTITNSWSTIGLKSYEQGRGSFEGTAKHFIWLDEEPPEAVYGECLMRTATTRGIIYLTFTPLEGMSKVVLGFLPQTQEM